MPDFLRQLFQSNFMPHGYCLKWDSELVWTMIVSNIAIALAYYSIPATLMIFLRKRKDLAFPWIFALFATFIFACGTTHLVTVLNIYKGYYWLEAIVGLFTAIVSIITAVVLWPLIPKALSLPSPKELSKANEELTRLNDKHIELNAQLTNVNRQLTEARDQAIVSSNLKSWFLANISHELRTPLSAVLGMNELLMHSNLSKEQRILADGVDQSGQALLLLVNDLLDLSKIEAGKVSIEAVPIDISELAKETVALFETAAKTKHILLTLHIDPRITGTYLGDPARIKQVLVNLLGNALKFTDHGEVALHVISRNESEDQVDLEFTISDTGIGLTDEEQKQIFQPFTQVDQTTSRKYGGAGLGLTISKQLVELMRGEIGVRSAKDKGSSFWCILPLGVCDESLVQKQDKGKEPETFSRPRGNVLIVEDDLLLQQLAATQLRRLGVNRTIVANGQEAIKAIEQNKFDLILMDCFLPIMDGFETTQKIREMEIQTGDHLPIVAMTAGAMAGDQERCLNAGMDDYLSKPYTLKQLSEMLGKWLPTVEITIQPVENHEHARANDGENEIRHDRLNLDKIKQIAATDKVPMLLSLYLSSTQTSIKTIEKGLEDHNWNEIANQAHKILGASRTLDAEDMINVSSRLYQAAKDGKTDDVFKEATALLEAFAQISKEIENIPSSE